MQISGLILAGGRSSRMGGDDKGLLNLLDRPMITHVIQRLEPQVDEILISANRHIDQYQKYTYEVLLDDYDDFRGPMAGMVRGLSHCKSEYLLTVPCDGPLLPHDLAFRMLELSRQKNARAVLVFDGQYNQPAYNLLHKDLLDSITHALRHNEHKLGKWLMDHGALQLDCSMQKSAFINVNTSADLQQLESHLRSLPSSP